MAIANGWWPFCPGQLFYITPLPGGTSGQCILSFFLKKYDSFKTSLLLGFWQSLANIKTRMGMS
jgi:hypothetical protein